jgi:hypothetical protein
MIGKMVELNSAIGVVVKEDDEFYWIDWLNGNPPWQYYKRGYHEFKVLT